LSRVPDGTERAKGGQMRVGREGTGAQERGEGGEMIESNRIKLSLSSLLFPSDENKKITKGLLRGEGERGS
jgi:hypothetical protein